MHVLVNVTMLLVSEVRCCIGFDWDGSLFRVFVAGTAEVAGLCLVAYYVRCTTVAADHEAVDCLWAAHFDRMSHVGCTIGGRNCC